MGGGVKEMSNDKDDKHTGFPVIYERRFPGPTEWFLVYLVGVASAVTAEHWSGIVTWVEGTSPHVQVAASVALNWTTTEWSNVSGWVRSFWTSCG